MIDALFVAEQNVFVESTKTRQQQVVLQSFLFLLEMDHVSTQAVYIFFSNLFFFNVPCVQNQNQSVHLLVPDKVCTGKGGLISKSFFFFPVQLILTDMYIQISQPQILSIFAKKEPNFKSKKLQKLQIKQYISLFKIELINNYIMNMS